jgi:hypothetical protein
MAVMSRTADSRYSPARASPVRSTSAPTAYGATNPPRLPNELIRAIPAAAAAPASAAFGSSQKGEMAEKMPMAHTQMATIAHTGLACRRIAEPSSPTEPSSIENVACPTRSLVRSECRLQ